MRFIIKIKKIFLACDVKCNSCYESQEKCESCRATSHRSDPPFCECDEGYKFEGGECVGTNIF